MAITHQITAKDLIVTEEVIRWLERRAKLQAGIDTINNQLAMLQASQIAENPTHPKFKHLLQQESFVARDPGSPTFRDIQKNIKRVFVCSCGAEFLFELDRRGHIDEYGATDHKPNGEIQDGKHILHDTTIKGNPIANVVKVGTRKGTFKRALSFDDLDEII